MASDLNKIILIGRTTRDFEFRYTPAGTPVASTSIANNKSYKNNSGEKTDAVSYFDIIAWNKLAEIMTEYVKKGHRIAVEGRLTQRRWKDTDDKWHTKVEVVVESFQFLEGKKDDTSKGAPEKSAENDYPDETFPMNEDPDDIPF